MALHPGIGSPVVDRLGPRDVPEVLSFLEDDPVLNVYLIALVLRDALARPHDAWWGARREGRLTAVLFAGAHSGAVLPAGSLDPMLLLDLGRALLAGAGTLGIFLLLPPLPIFAGVAACVAAFALLGLAVGLIGRQDLALLRLAARAGPEAGTPTDGADPSAA